MGILCGEERLVPPPASACGSGLSPFLPSCCLSEESVSGQPVFPEASHWRPWAKGPRRKVVPIRSVTDPLVGKKVLKQMREHRDCTSGLCSLSSVAWDGFLFFSLLPLALLPIIVALPTRPPSFFSYQRSWESCRVSKCDYTYFYLFPPYFYH